MAQGVNSMFNLLEACVGYFMVPSAFPRNAPTALLEVVKVYPKEDILAYWIVFQVT